MAGILAVAISTHGQKSPEALTKDLKDHAAKSVTFGLQDLGAAMSSNNLLAKPW